MAILPKRSNKKYSYQPRYFQQEEGSRPFEMKNRFDEHRTTIEKVNLKQKLNNAVRDYNSGIDQSTKVRLYIIIAILVLIFLFIMDFDLSIFA